MLLDYLAMLSRGRGRLELADKEAYLAWYKHVGVITHSFIAARHVNAVVACPERYLILGYSTDTIAETYVKLRTAIELLDTLCLIDCGGYDDITRALKQACVTGSYLIQYPNNYRCVDGSIVYGL